MKYWCRHFVPFYTFARRSSTVRDARCWVLDTFPRDAADIHAHVDGVGGGIAFAREEDMALFLLRWT